MAFPVHYELCKVRVVHVVKYAAAIFSFQWSGNPILGIPFINAFNVTMVVRFSTDKLINKKIPTLYGIHLIAIQNKNFFLVPYVPFYCYSL